MRALVRGRCLWNNLLYWESCLCQNKIKLSIYLFQSLLLMNRTASCFLFKEKRDVFNLMHSRRPDIDAALFSLESLKMYKQSDSSFGFYILVKTDVQLIKTCLELLLLFRLDFFLIYYWMPLVCRCCTPRFRFSCLRMQFQYCLIFYKTQRENRKSIKYKELPRRVMMLQQSDIYFTLFF